MTGRLNVILSLISHYKYLIVCVIGVLIVGLIDENSFLKRFQLEMQISDLKSEINKYTEQYEADSRQLNELKRHPKAIEKIARERYFMKADDEDIYVLSDDKKPIETNNEATEESTKHSFHDRWRTHGGGSRLLCVHVCHTDCMLDCPCGLHFVCSDADDADL